VERLLQYFAEPVDAEEFYKTVWIVVFWMMTL
jgi:hypothetical protein